MQKARSKWSGWGAAIVTVLQRVMDIIEPARPEPKRRRIGFRENGK